MTETSDTFGTTATLTTADGPVSYYRLATLARELDADLDRMPFTVKILLENVLRLNAQGAATQAQLERLARWQGGQPARGEFPFLPARVLLQDFTGVPA